MQTYEFICTGCDEPKSVYLTFASIMEERPTCEECNTKLLPNLDYLRNLPIAKMQDVEIHPMQAAIWLSAPVPSFGAEVDEATVTRYAVMMASGQWLNATRNSGGEQAPIVTVNDHLMLGFQRLLACYDSGTPFTNTVIEVNDGR